MPQDKRSGGYATLLEWTNIYCDENPTCTRCAGSDSGQYSKPLPPRNSRRIEVGGTWSG